MGGSRSLLAIFVSTSLMIIHDLDAIPCAIATDEADSPLIVATDPMLTLPVTAQRLQPASWNCPHVLQFLGVVQHPKLPPRTLQPRGRRCPHRGSARQAPRCVSASAPWPARNLSGLTLLSWPLRLLPAERLVGCPQDTGSRCSIV